jgi:hypothetical protein
MVSHYTQRMRRQEDVNSILTKILSGLSILPPAAFNELLFEVAQECEEVECLYVLDNDGIQVSDTMFRQQPKARNSLFAPVTKGGEHQLKNYYLAVAHSGMERFCSDPYLSLASGNLCRTVSTAFTGMDDYRYILCVDFQS